VEGSSLHPSLKRQGEGRGAYSVLRVDVPKWYVFPGTLLFMVKTVGWAGPGDRGVGGVSYQGHAVLTTTSVPLHVIRFL
jgi:hypothetical protein